LISVTASSRRKDQRTPELAGSPVTLIYRRNRVTTFLRRCVDAALASLALVLASPIIAAAMLAIFVEDGGPVLFRQRRIGRFERTFTMYKLRTMRVEACGDRPSPTGKGDERITRVGRLLRKTSIDELPQLLNVMLGHMSLIGPRPEMPFIVARYENWQHLRHLVTPGLTCIWQTTCRSTIPLASPEATAFDLEYIRRASPALDLQLLIRTAAAIVRPNGAF
jgi:lipopolysaccharide/colanic/teichoic acid biosynthesis glycosyltransferase